MKREAITSNDLPFDYEWRIAIGGADEDGTTLHIHTGAAHAALHIARVEHLESLSRQLMDAALEVRAAILAKQTA